MLFKFLSAPHLLCAALLVSALSPVANAQDDPPAKGAVEKKADDKPADPKAADPKAADPKAADPKAAAEEKLPEDFAGLNTAWEQLQAKLEDVADKYRKAFSSEDRKKIFDEDYKPLVNRAERLLPLLREAARVEFKKNPGKDEKLTQLLLGFASDAVRRDDYGMALEIGKMLRDGKCEDTALHYILGVSAYSTQDFDLALTELKAGEEARVLGPRELQLVDGIPELKKNWEAEKAIRAKEEAADDLPRVKFTTNRGVIVVELFENEAPQAVANFVHLVKEKFYDGLTFHRVLGNFMAQGGCPQGTGVGGPGYNIYCECHQENYRKHFQGTLSMAHAGRDTGGSQFFLTFRPTPSLDGRHTAFGRVVEGMEVLAELQRRDPTARGQASPDKILGATITRDRGHEYKPTKVGEKPEPKAPPAPEPSKK